MNYNLNRHYILRLSVTIQFTFNCNYVHLIWQVDKHIIVLIFCTRLYTFSRLRYIL